MIVSIHRSLGIKTSSQLNLQSNISKRGIWCFGWRKPNSSIRENSSASQFTNPRYAKLKHLVTVQKFSYKLQSGNKRITIRTRRRSSVNLQRCSSASNSCPELISKTFQNCCCCLVVFYRNIRLALRLQVIASLPNTLWPAYKNHNGIVFFRVILKVFQV